MKTSSMKRIAWPPFIILALLALFLHRTQLDCALQVGSWMLEQGKQAKLAKLDFAPKYLCIGEKVFALGDSGEIELAEDKLILEGEEAQKKCRLPLLPEIEEARPLLISTSPTTGHFASLMYFDRPSSEALKTIVTKLELAGWREAGSNEKKKDSNLKRALMYERGDAWLFCAMASKEPANDSKILLAGRLGPF